MRRRRLLTPPLRAVPFLLLAGLLPLEEQLLPGPRAGTRSGSFDAAVAGAIETLAEQSTGTPETLNDKYATSPLPGPT